MTDPRARRQGIHDLYARQLHEQAGAQFVRSFELRNRRNSTDFFLFFATNSARGLEKMKEAMWRVDPNGNFRFSDATVTGQPVMFESEPDFSGLRRLIEHQFVGRTIAVEDIERFVIERTPFLDTHYKRHVLAEMEREQPAAIVVVGAKPGRRQGTFPAATRVRFSNRA